MTDQQHPITPPHELLNDFTRCHGVGCDQRHVCARRTAPIPENVLLSWAINLNPERAHMCPEFIYNIKKEESND